MSIIYDALKKVEKSNLTEKPKPVGENSDRDHKHSYKAYLFYISIIIVGILTGNLFFVFIFRSSHRKTDVAELNKPQIKKAEPSIKEDLTLPLATPENQQSPQAPASLVLNGIFFSEDQGYALINNQIVKEADTVAGATVVRVTLDEVELTREGSTFKLSTGAR